MNIFRYRHGKSLIIIITVTFHAAREASGGFVFEDFRFHPLAENAFCAFGHVRHAVVFVRRDEEGF